VLFAKSIHAYSLEILADKTKFAHKIYADPANTP